MNEIVGIWDVLSRRVKRNTGKDIDILMLRQSLENFDKVDLNEEEIANLIADAMYSKSFQPDNVDINEIISDMELMGLLIPTTPDLNVYNQIYTVNISESVLRERFGLSTLRKTKRFVGNVGIANEGPSGKTTYNKQPKLGHWERPEIFRESKRLQESRRLRRSVRQIIADIK